MGIEQTLEEILAVLQGIHQLLAQQDEPVDYRFIKSQINSQQQMSEEKAAVVDDVFDTTKW